MATLQLGGCGGMLHFIFGLGAYIQEHYVLDETVTLRTISGSNFVAACMLSNRSVESIWRLWSRRLDDLVRQQPWTGLYHMMSMAKGHTAHVQSELEIRMQQHHVRIAGLDSMTTFWAHTHTDHKDYDAALLAGSFIPGLCGRLWTIYRGQRCLDGGVRLPYTRRRSMPLETTLSVNVVELPIFSYTRLVWMVLYGLWSRSTHHEWQYACGYEYAQQHLTPKLDTLLVRRSSRILLPELTGYIRWDLTQKKFVPTPE